MSITISFTAPSIRLSLEIDTGCDLPSTLSLPQHLQAFSTWDIKYEGLADIWLTSGRGCDENTLSEEEG